VESSSWRSRYIHLCSPLDMKGLGSHILLIPGELEDTNRKLSLSTDVIRAASVLVLSPERDRRSLAFLPPIRSTARSDCVGLIDLPETPLRSRYGRIVPRLNTYDQFLAAWFIDMVRELSHDQPLDIALFEQWRQTPDTQPPVLMSSRRLIKDSRIGTRLSRLASQFKNPLIKDLEFHVGPETATRCRLPSFSAPSPSRKSVNGFKPPR